jgi:hypothetical protein
MLLGQFPDAERAMPTKTAITNLLNLSDVLLLLYLLLGIAWKEIVADLVGYSGIVHEERGRPLEAESC